MAELTSDNANNRLAAGTPAQGIFLDQEPASSDGFYFGPLRQRDTPAGVVAYEVLLKRVYQHFGQPRAAIPFIRNGAVDEDLIKTINPPRLRNRARTRHPDRDRDWTLAPENLREPWLADCRSMERCVRTTPGEYGETLRTVAANSPDKTAQPAPDPPTISPQAAPRC
jgi:hypothetical protein